LESSSWLSNIVAPPQEEPLAEVYACFRDSS